jgi:hypothetical protein
VSRPEQAVERRGPRQPAVDPAMTWADERQEMRMVVAKAGLSQTRPALRCIAGVRELAQLHREEVLVQHSWRAATGADEVVRDPLPQFCLISYPGPKLGRVTAWAEQAAVNLLGLPQLLPVLAKPTAIAPMLLMAAWLPAVRGQAAPQRSAAVDSPWTIVHAGPPSCRTARRCRAWRRSPCAARCHRAPSWSPGRTQGAGGSSPAVRSKAAAHRRGASRITGRLEDHVTVI